jgi:N-acetylglutamate synthase-like GNAT family acetyltransferase
LFTETAAHFFERFGFKDVARDELPEIIHGCFEFGFCPDTSRSMRLDLMEDRSAATSPCSH